MAISYRKRLLGQEAEFIQLVQAHGLHDAMTYYDFRDWVAGVKVYDELCKERNIPPVEGHCNPLPQSGSDLLDQLCGKLERIAERYATSLTIQKAQNDKKDAKIDELERKLAFYERGRSAEWQERILRTNEIFDHILAGEG